MGSISKPVAGIVGLDASGTTTTDSGTASTAGETPPSIVSPLANARAGDAASAARGDANDPRLPRAARDVDVDAADDDDDDDASAVAHVERARANARRAMWRDIDEDGRARRRRADRARVEV